MWSCLSNVSNVRLGRFSQEAVERSRRVEFSGRPGGLHGRIPAHEVGRGSVRDSGSDTPASDSCAGNHRTCLRAAGLSSCTQHDDGARRNNNSYRDASLDRSLGAANREGQAAISSRDSEGRARNSITHPNLAGA